MKAIEVINLTRNFNGLCAVDGISFEVEQGEIFGFLGPNGAGKTTTIRMLTGQLRPSSGSARVMGCDVVHERGSMKPRIGVVFEARQSPQPSSKSARTPSMVLIRASGKLACCWNFRTKA